MDHSISIRVRLSALTNIQNIPPKHVTEKTLETKRASFSPPVSHHASEHETSCIED
jgi:hypothetical protein